MLRSQGVEIHLYEKHIELMREASGNNQFRLHLGLHYARSAITRHQSRDGFARFSERYPRFSRSVDSNIYIVPKRDSLLDFETYFSIMFSSGINIDKTPVNKLDFVRQDLMGGAISCQERVVLTSAARRHFTQVLAGIVRLGCPVSRLEMHNQFPVILGEKYDYLIDATWGAFSENQDACYFEPTILLYYRYTGKGVFPALTLVDGELWSIYPTEEDNIYTLSSVMHTPLSRCRRKFDAYNHLTEVNHKIVDNKRKLMEAEVMQYFPDFPELFEFVGPQLSIKTKPIGKSDDRSASVHRIGRFIAVNSGKIDTIFYAGDAIAGIVLNE